MRDLLYLIVIGTFFNACNGKSGRSVEVGHETTIKSDLADSVGDASKKNESLEAPPPIFFIEISKIKFQSGKISPYDVMVESVEDGYRKKDIFLRDVDEQNTRSKIGFECSANRLKLLFLKRISIDVYNSHLSEAVVDGIKQFFFVPPPETILSETLFSCPDSQARGTHVELSVEVDDSDEFRPVVSVSFEKI